MTDTAIAIAVPIIAQFEGFSAKPYQDQVGVWTQGYGQTYDLSGKPITARSAPMTEADAKKYLTVLVGTYMEKVRGMVHVPVTDNQAAALCSLAYNIGTAALRSSSLMAALNQGRTQEAADAFRSWIYAGGKPNTGLRNRREKERTLFLSAPPATPVKHTNPSDMTADELMDYYQE